MTNWVKNTIAFDKEHADKILPVCCPNGEFDFHTLIPSSDDWSSKWNAAFSKIIDDSGTDVNAHLKFTTGRDWCDAWLRASRSRKFEITERFGAGKILICFETAWMTPTPIIAAFAERFGITFDYMYSEEGLNFWGIDVISVDENGEAVIIDSRSTHPDDFYRCYGFSYDELFCEDDWLENERHQEYQLELKRFAYPDAWDNFHHACSSAVDFNCSNEKLRDQAIMMWVMFDTDFDEDFSYEQYVASRLYLIEEHGIDILDRHWRETTGLMRGLYYGYFKPIPDFLTWWLNQKGWEWTGETYNHPDPM